jgi:hypothetical protein
MKRRWTIIGIILILAGSTFALQGLNVLLGSFMSGRSEWLYIGAVMAAAGAVVLVLANRRPPGP